MTGRRRVKENWDDIAAAIGVPVRTLHEWRAIGGSPRDSKDADTWREWMDETGHDYRPRGEDDDGDPALKAEKLRQEIRFRKLKNDALEGRMTGEARDEARAFVIGEAKRLRSVLVGLLPAQIARDGAGKTGPELEPLVRKAIESALEAACQE